MHSGVLQMVRKVKERGEPFVTNGHSIFAGPYKVERIDANGDLKSGLPLHPQRGD